MLDKSILAAAVIFASFGAVAEVTLTVPKEAQLMVVNEEHSEYSVLGFGGDTKVIIPDGENQILFRRAHIVREEGSDKTKYKSVPFIVAFTASNTAVNLKLPKVDTLDQSRVFDKNPVITLESGAEDIPYIIDTLSTGFNLMPDYVREVQDYNRKGGIASVDFGHVIDTRYTKVKNGTEGVNASGIVSTTNQSEGIEADQMLKFWFKQADAATQKQFISWAVQNIN